MKSLILLKVQIYIQKSYLFYEDKICIGPVSVKFSRHIISWRNQTHRPDTDTICSSVVTLVWLADFLLYLIADFLLGFILGIFLEVMINLHLLR